MSSVSGASGSNMETLAVAFNKRATQQQGAMAMALLDSAVQTSQQVSAQGAQIAAAAADTLAVEGSLGTQINIHA